MEIHAITPHHTLGLYLDIWIEQQSALAIEAFVIEGTAGGR
jgi:hypothetical protein